MLGRAVFPRTIVIPSELSHGAIINYQLATVHERAPMTELPQGACDYDLRPWRDSCADRRRRSCACGHQGGPGLSVASREMTQPLPDVARETCGRCAACASAYVDPHGAAMTRRVFGRVHRASKPAL